MTPEELDKLDFQGTKSPDMAAVLLEQIVHQNRAVLEAVGAMQEKVAVLPAMQDDIAELKRDMKVVRAGVADLSNQVHEHERRITRLEAA